MPMPIKTKEKIQTAKKRLKATVVSFALLNIIKCAFIFEIIKLEVFKLYRIEI